MSHIRKRRASLPPRRGARAIGPGNVATHMHPDRLPRRPKQALSRAGQRTTHSGPVDAVSTRHSPPTGRAGGPTRSPASAAWDTRTGQPSAADVSLLCHSIFWLGSGGPSPRLRGFSGKKCRQNRNPLARAGLCAPSPPRPHLRVTRETPVEALSPGASRMSAMAGPMSLARGAARSASGRTDGRGLMSCGRAGEMRPR